MTSIIIFHQFKETQREIERKKETEVEREKGGELEMERDRDLLREKDYKQKGINI